MVDFKVVIGHKDKSFQREVKDADTLLGMKIGQKVKGDSLGLEGYEFEITGGSDKCGFPMRNDLNGVKRTKIYSSKSQGIKSNRKGIVKRKSMAGNTIFDGTAQINLKVLKEGKEKLGGEEAPKEDGAEAEAPKEEAKAEETPKEEKKEEAPKEDKKEDASKEEKEEAPEKKE